MNCTSTGDRRKPESGPAYVHHPSFESTPEDQWMKPVQRDPEAGHLNEEQTRLLAQAMHYAAWRADCSRTEIQREHWTAKYFQLRDEIILGNQKLVYRAVHRWRPSIRYQDEMIGACHLIFIQTVAAYNPWIGVRFSTYAFTCLLRALSRQSHRQNSDLLGSWTSLDVLDGSTEKPSTLEQHSSELKHIYELLKEEHPLLSDREKHIIVRRYNLNGAKKKGTLTQVGQELGLSKERARQLQLKAIDKIRDYLINV